MFEDIAGAVHSTELDTTGKRKDFASTTTRRWHARPLGQATFSSLFSSRSPGSTVDDGKDHPVYMGFPARPSLSAVDSSLTPMARLGHLERSTLQYVRRVQALKATKSYAHRYSPLLGHTTGIAQKLKLNSEASSFSPKV